MNSPAQSLAPLDGIRGIAAFAVFFGHLGISGYLPETRGLGQLGVMLFFVLSGFLMGYLYMDRPRNLREWGDYAIRRIFRVYPLFVACVLICFMLYDLGGWRGALPVTRNNVVDHLLLTEGVGVFWTIPVEMKYYLLFPFIATAVVFAPESRIRLCIIVFLFVMFAMLPLNAEKVQVWKYVVVFLAGMLAAEIYRVANHVPTVAWNIVLAIGLLLAILLVPFVSRTLLGDHLHVWNYAFIAVVPFFLIVLGAAKSSGPLAWLLSSKPMRFLGAISYSLYLTHLPILRFVKKNVDMQPDLEALIIVAVVILFSWITYQLLESPFRRVGRKVSDRLLRTETINATSK